MKQSFTVGADAMGLMRELGLILHHAFKPARKSPAAKVVHQQTKVQEQRISQTTTLRRTTIEEIEVREEPHEEKD